MSLRLRTLIGVVAIVAAGLLALLWQVLVDVRPHTFGTTEESLVETAVMLASLVESRSAPTGTLVLDELRTTMDGALSRPLDARIYDFEKKRVDLRTYVTDARGVVVYDSDGGHAEGEDYSSWRDVKRALQGTYGSRATRGDRNDTYSAVFYVAVPIRLGGRIGGVLAVGKRARDVKVLMASLQRNVLIAGGVTLAGAAAVGLLLATWITQPIRQLAAHAREVAAGRRPQLPALASREIAELGAAFESMRDALDGRRDIEGYVRSLTHETKAPLSAIRASAELLEEDPPEADKRRFLQSIRSETARLQDLVDRILELSSLEARHSLADPVPIDLASVAAEVAESAAPVARQKEIAVSVTVPAIPGVRGDRLLVRQALMNLMQNALRWTPRGGTIAVEGERHGGLAVLRVSDSGAGVPEYALPRVFEKFYSVPLPGEGKGSGLGLPFVREVALLHGGEARLENNKGGGATATLALKAE